MASAVASQKLRSALSVTHYDFDPDATTATDVAWVSMANFESFLVSFFRTVGTGDVTLKILANTKSDGSGTDIEIKSISNADLGDPDAVGDYVFAECSASEIAYEAAKVGISHPLYVTANLTFATATDEGVVTYIRGGAKIASEALTTSKIA